MDNNIRNITLQLDAHSFRLQVRAEEEPFFRQAAQLVNERYKAYRKKMPEVSAEYIWAYVALYVAVNLHSDARLKAIEPVMEKLLVLNKHIEETLTV